MTDPKQASRGARGMRVYKWPPQPPHDLEVVSVTSITGNGIPKPFLAPWSAKMVAEFAVDHIDDWKGLATSDPSAAIDMLKRAPYRYTGEKADMGTIAHAAAEAYVSGSPLNEPELDELLKERRVPLDRWKTTRGYVRAAIEFLVDREPEILHSEATVYSRAHGYAGTTDLLVKIPIGKSTRVAVVDFKTSKAIYDEVGLQLCAYARAEFVGLDDGTEVELPQGITDGIAVRLMPSGRYEPVPFALTDELFDVFLAARGVALGAGAIARSRRPS